MLELALLASLQQQTRITNPAGSYFVYVASEEFDQVALVRFGPAGASVEHRTPIRLPGVDSVGPRSLRIAPAGGYLYLATTRGFPIGELLKIRIGADSASAGQPVDTIRGREPLGSFPESVQVTPDGEYALVTNSAPAGADTPSWISVVYLAQMVEVARVETCGDARGGRLTADGARHFSVCAGDDRLVELGVHAMTVTRRLALPGAGQKRCEPDAVTVTADGGRVYIACRQSNDVVEVDAASWSIRRRFVVGSGPGDLALTHDDRTLVVANADGRSISIVDVATGRETGRVGSQLHLPAAFTVDPNGPGAMVALSVQLARLVSTQQPANVVISPDDRYAFVSIAGRGADAGSVDVIDLGARALAATVEVGRGAHGIDFWKQQAPKL